MNPIRNKTAGIFLLLITAVFVLPFIAAWFLFQHAGESSLKTSNHGYLINPPFMLTQLKITTSRVPTTNPLKVETDNKNFELVIPGKWILFTLNPGRCHEACQHSLYNIRQIRTATNADQNRVVTAILNFSDPKNDLILTHLLKERYPNTYSLIANDQRFRAAVNKSVKHNYALLEGAIYIADPLCNVILVYAPNTNPEYIYKDLHHLLQVSQIG